MADIAEIFCADGRPAELSGPPAVRALPVNEAFIALIGAIFRVDAADAQINSRKFEVLADLTNTVPCLSLAYEREYHWLPEVQQTIIRTLQTKSE